MTALRISCKQLINSIYQLIKTLSTYKIVQKALKKNKNNTSYIHLKHIDQSHNKKIMLIVDNINNNLTKTCFYNLYITAKIMQNASINLISKITTKLSKINIDFWKLFLNISIKRNCYNQIIID